MSTRTQIRLIEKGKHYDLYHHCDGYFEGVGKTLKDTLNEVGSKGAKAVIRALKKADKTYEDTEALHGDIEYFYELDFDKDSFKGMAVGFPPWTKDTEFDSLYVAPIPPQDRDGKIVTETMDLKSGLVARLHIIE